MSELDRQVEDLIATAALDDADADELRAVIAEVKARKDAKLRGDVQRTVGETHLTLRDKLDQVITLQLDTRELIGGISGQLDGQGAALDAARAEFQGGLHEVGESVSQIKIDVAAVSDDVAIIRAEVIQHGKRLTHLEQGQRGITAQQRLQAGQIADLARLMEEQRTAYEQRLAELEAYRDEVSADERQRRIAQIEEQDRRIKRLEEQSGTASLES